MPSKRVHESWADGQMKAPTRRRRRASLGHHALRRRVVRAHLSGAQSRRGEPLSAAVAGLHDAAGAGESSHRPARGSGSERLRREARGLRLGPHGRPHGRLRRVPGRRRFRGQGFEPERGRRRRRRAERSERIARHATRDRRGRRRRQQRGRRSDERWYATGRGVGAKRVSVAAFASAARAVQRSLTRVVVTPPLRGELGRETLRKYDTDSFFCRRFLLHFYNVDIIVWMRFYYIYDVYAEVVEIIVACCYKRVLAEEYLRVFSFPRGGEDPCHFFSFIFSIQLFYNRELGWHSYHSNCVRLVSSRRRRHL